MLKTTSLYTPQVALNPDLLGQGEGMTETSTPDESGQVPIYRNARFLIPIPQVPIRIGILAAWNEDSRRVGACRACSRNGGNGTERSTYGWFCIRPDKLNSNEGDTSKS